MKQRFVEKYGEQKFKDFLKWWFENLFGTSEVLKGVDLSLEVFAPAALSDWDAAGGDFKKALVIGRERLLAVTNEKSSLRYVQGMNGVEKRKPEGGPVQCRLDLEVAF